MYEWKIALTKRNMPPFLNILYDSSIKDSNYVKEQDTLVIRCERLILNETNKSQLQWSRQVERGVYFPLVFNVRKDLLNGSVFAH